jgi:hypothetical protein
MQKGEQAKEVHSLHNIPQYVELQIAYQNNKC